MQHRFWVAYISFQGVLGMACVGELTEDVTEDVCFSGTRWIGGKHGHPEMYPVRDCVGCHIDNDGPQLVLGGTVYPYILGKPTIFAAQSGVDCYGIEGITVVVTDAFGSEYALETNRAGNFYIEGDPRDFAKPFTATVIWTNDDGDEKESAMSFTHPLYGGCARCHDPQVPTLIESGLTYDSEPTSPDYRNGQPRIGLPGYRDADLRALAERAVVP
jgi:hypothetical protein